MTTTPTPSGNVPRLEARTDLTEFCRRWGTAEPLRELIRAWGGTPPDPALPLPEIFAALDDFSQVWDFRQQRERNEMREPKFDDAQQALVAEATRALGVQDMAPPSKATFDHVLILGGLSRGCLARPLHAARLLSEGTVRAPRVTALGGLRPLSAGERDMLEPYGLADAPTEFEVMDAGVRRAFGLTEPVSIESQDGDDETTRWRVHRYAPVDGVTIEVVAAPSTRPGFRANTGETYAWLADVHRTLASGQSALIVTTYHYRLYQVADAVRELQLQRGIEVDAVGMAPGDIDPRLAWHASTAALLQETRSSIRALRALVGVL